MAHLLLADDLDNLLLSPFYGEPTLQFYHLPQLNIVPRRRHRDQHNKGSIVPTVGKDGFQVCMDVGQFKPSELSVKVVDNCVVVEGKHEEREDEHGYISRQFTRRYLLPEGYDANKVASTLSSDGVLTVSIPKPQIEDKSNERIVQIQQVGPAHLNVKENPKEEEKAGSKNDATAKTK